MSTTTSSTTDQPPATSRLLSLDDLFAEQQTLSVAEGMTAVETFSQAHDEGRAVPDQARYYKSLIPATPPKPGQQYAFEVDLDSCSGCKACVVACHSLNGLAEAEAWRDVGQLHGAKAADPACELPVLQHVTTACHHCLDPGCLKGCPVEAYEKDPATGIVRHLDDQCFGCQYCTLMCPYEVPKYHAGHGIVRKCDMCSDRLAEGEAPACVQACPHEAISIRTVSVDAVTVAAAKATVCDVKPRGEFAIPHSPRLDHTIPTTVYSTSKLDLSSLEPVDLRTPQPAHAHLPLTAMLTLSQCGVGGFLFAALAAFAGVAATSSVMIAICALAFVTANIGLALATLHLGRPHLAYRAVLGWRHSWLSREAIAFGVFMPFAGAALLFSSCGTVADLVGFRLPAFLTQTVVERGFVASIVLAAITGIVAVATSAMIYVVTRKPLWSLSRTASRFSLTTLVGGASFLMVADSLFSDAPSKVMPIAVIALTVAKALFDAAIVFRANGDRSEPLVRSAVLMGTTLKPVLQWRLGFAGVGVLLAAVSLAWSPIAVLAAIAVILGELFERWLFFTAAVGQKMPGQVTTKLDMASIAPTPLPEGGLA